MSCGRLQTFPNPEFQGVAVDGKLWKRPITPTKNGIEKNVVIIEEKSGEATRLLLAPVGSSSPARGAAPEP
jgi:hypothetical protein